MKNNSKQQGVYTFIVILLFAIVSNLFPSKGWYYLFMYLIITSPFLFQELSRKERVILIFGGPVVVIVTNLLFNGTFF